MTTTSIDETRLEAFMARAVADIGAVFSAPLLMIGEKLGLYKAMAHAGPLSSHEVAERSGMAERYVREWLRNQAAGGYVFYDGQTDRYTLPDEHALAVADEDSPFYILGAYEAIASLYADEEHFLEAFRTGRGLGWHEHDRRLFRGTERFFRPGYLQHFPSEWIPALNGLEEKLSRGAKVADVGCGHGASTIIMAQAFPNSRFHGYDYHDASIAAARNAAAEAGVADRITFEVASAKDYPGSGYDLVCMFDCLHDMGDPVGAAAHVLDTLAQDGTWMIVEPFAHDRGVEENLNAIGRVFYAASNGDLHASITGARSRAGTRRPGRRGAAHRRHPTRRIHSCSASYRNPVQPHPRGETLTRLGQPRRPSGRDRRSSARPHSRPRRRRPFWS